ncbi:MAG: hypothetical protein P4L30_02720 [Candidatus Limnocylindrales bacterium]|nr:hypothetical protein [Candidatus Limnocylindrales bacterium]
MSGARASAVQLRGRVADAWARGSLSRRAAIVAGGTVTLALAGAFLFGAWHVLFGWLVKGNPRAGAFGVALAAVSAALLWLEARLLRRRFSR